MARGTPFAVSLVYVMYAYAGWNASTYVVGEIPRSGPQRPPFPGARHAPRDSSLRRTQCHLSSYRTDGRARGQTRSRSRGGEPHFWQSGRADHGRAHLRGSGFFHQRNDLGRSASHDGHGRGFHPLAWLGRKTRSGVPAIAILAQGSVVGTLLLTASFETVLTYIQFSLTFCSFLTVLGVIVLRFTQPRLARPYKTWGYPMTPLFFLLVSAWMLWQVAWERPRESLAGFATMLLGLALFALSKRSRST